MSDDPNSLEGRLRSRAERDLQNTLNATFTELKQRLDFICGYNNHWRWEPVPGVIRRVGGPGDGNFNTVTIVDVLEAVQKAIEVRERQRHGDEAIKAFMERVDRLGQEVEELRESAAGDE